MKINPIILLLFLLGSCSINKSTFGPTHTNLHHAEHRLNLSNLNIQKLPDVSQVKDLKMLDLSNNKELNLIQALSCIPHPENLQILILDSLDLTTLPLHIKRFRNLKQLSLANNPNIDLEQLFKNLEGLSIQFLNLSHNKIEALPSSIDLLVDLKDLNLSFNQLKDQDSYKHLSRLNKLYNLWLDHNDLHEIPATISHLNQIVYLYLDGNHLTTLPESFTKMKKLKVIHAGFNEFQELPIIFTQMKGLILVHINNNPIRKIPGEYKTEKYSLSGLILDGHQLTDQQVEETRKWFRGFFLISYGS